MKHKEKKRKNSESSFMTWHLVTILSIFLINILML